MNLTEWNARLHGLVIFRALLDDDVIAKFVDFTAFSIRLQRDKTTVFSVSILLFILVLQY